MGFVSFLSTVLYYVSLYIVATGPRTLEYLLEEGGSYHAFQQHTHRVYFRDRPAPRERDIVILDIYVGLLLLCAASIWAYVSSAVMIRVGFVDNDDRIYLVNLWVGVLSICYVIRRIYHQGARGAGQVGAL